MKVYSDNPGDYEDHDASTPDEHTRKSSEHNAGKSARGPKRITRARLVACLTTLNVRLRHDTFADEPQISFDTSKFISLTDARLRRLWTDSELALGFLPSKGVFEELVLDEAIRHSCDDLNNYLNGLLWDSRPRLAQMLHTYFGADDTQLHSAFGICSMIGAVRRALVPGCKHDTMLVLEGQQGTLKSSALRELAPNPRWFHDGLKLDADARAMVEQTGGKWIIEIAELGGIRRADVDNLKGLLSRGSDKARPAYGRQLAERQRRFVLFGSVNPGASGYLKDNTGGRRFWPVVCGTIDLDAIRRDRNHLWAEAVHRHRAGEPNWLSAELEVGAEAAADERREEVVWAEALRGETEGRSRITAVEALHLLRVPTERHTPAATTQVAEALKEIGFTKANKQKNTTRYWTRA